MTTRRRTAARRNQRLDFFEFNAMLWGHAVKDTYPPSRDEAEEAYWCERDRFHLRWQRQNPNTAPPFAVLLFEPEAAPEWDLDSEYPKHDAPINDLPGWRVGSWRLDELWEREVDR